MIFHYTWRVLVAPHNCNHVAKHKQYHKYHAHDLSNRSPLRDANTITTHMRISELYRISLSYNYTYMCLDQKLSFRNSLACDTTACEDILKYSKTKRHKVCQYKRGCFAWLIKIGNEVLHARCVEWQRYIKWQKSQNFNLTSSPSASETLCLSKYHNSTLTHTRYSILTLLCFLYSRTSCTKVRETQLRECGASMSLHFYVQHAIPLRIVVQLADFSKPTRIFCDWIAHSHAKFQRDVFHKERKRVDLMRKCEASNHPF